MFDSPHQHNVSVRIQSDSVGDSWGHPGLFPGQSQVWQTEHEISHRKGQKSFIVSYLNPQTAILVPTSVLTSLLCDLRTTSTSQQLTPTASLDFTQWYHKLAGNVSHCSFYSGCTQSFRTNSRKFPLGFSAVKAVWADLHLPFSQPAQSGDSASELSAAKWNHIEEKDLDAWVQNMRKEQSHFRGFKWENELFFQRFYFGSAARSAQWFPEAHRYRVYGSRERGGCRGQWPI